MTPRFRDLRDNLIAKKYPYKSRLLLKESSNFKVFTSHAINQLHIPSGILGDGIIRDKNVQLATINLLIIFGRISTNLMVKAAYAHALYSDSDFWNAIQLDFSSSDITEDDFKKWFSALIVRLSLGWGYGKINTATSKFNQSVGGKIPVAALSEHLQNKAKSDVKWLLEEAASDTTIDLTSFIDSPILSPVDGDGYLDNDYQDVIDKELKVYLKTHNIVASSSALNKLTINLFRPNNDPLNPHSTINSENRFAEIQKTGNTSREPNTGTERVIASSSTTPKTGDQVPIYKNTGWFLEWAPAQSFGIAALPIEVAYPAKLPMQNVLAIKDASAAERLETYLTDVNFLPLSAAHMVMLQNFQTTRRVLTATNVTFASKYVQALTENFPQFSMEINAVRFGNLHERVLSFIDALVTFVSNPRKYPGSVFIYNSFMNEMPVLQSAVPYRARIFKRYEIIPLVYSKRADAQNNTIIRITINGIVVGSNENS